MKKGQFYLSFTKDKPFTEKYRKQFKKKKRRVMKYVRNALPDSSSSNEHESSNDLVNVQKDMLCSGLKIRVKTY